MEFSKKKKEKRITCTKDFKRFICKEYPKLKLYPGWLIPLIWCCNSTVNKPKDIPLIESSSATKCIPRNEELKNCSWNCDLKKINSEEISLDFFFFFQNYGTH